MTTVIKPSQLAAILAKTIPAKKPVLISGPPGCGKTDITEQACKAAGAKLITFHPVVSDPTDFKGMPWVTKDGAEFMPFGDLKALINAKDLTFAFFDDLGTAPTSVQAAVMQLLLARQINGHKISEHVVFGAATNRRSDRAGVQGILEPVKSRFLTILEMGIDATDWRAWGAANGIRSEVLAYIAYRPDALSEFKATADMTNSPSPRTWGRVSEILDLDMPKDVEMPMFEGAVGEARAQEFTAYLRIWQSLVSPDLVLSSPDTAPIPTEPSALYAIVTAIAERVRPKSMGNYCRYLERLTRDAEGGIFAACSMKMAKARDASLTATPGYIKAMSGPLGQLMLGA